MITILIIWVILSIILLPIYVKQIREANACNQNPIIKAAEDIIRGQ